MFVYLFVVVCSSLEKALLVEGDVHKAIFLVSTREGPLDYFYSYFVRKVFMNQEDEALVDIVSSDNHKSARDIVLGMLSIDSNRTNEEAEYSARLLWRIANKVSRRYLRNHHNFLAMESFRRLERDKLSKKKIDDIITMIYSGDRSSANLFISLLDMKRIYVGDYVDVLKYLVSINHPRAFGYLGEIYYHGIGVKRSLDRAMYLFSRGKELRDAVGACGVGKVLMSSEYMDYENAREALAFANRIAQSGEADYLTYLLFKGQARYEHHAGPHLESALMYGYLPAICRDGLRYYANREYLNACIRFHPIVEYSEVVYDLRKLAEKSFVSGKYRQSVLALLMCVELGSISALRNAVHVLRKYFVFEDQEKILFDLYMKLLIKGNYDVLNRIGDAYFYGSGVGKSHDDAFSFYMSSALLKNPEGYYNVAYMYENGYGVQKSLRFAFRYISKIMPTDEMYLLLFYTYIRLFSKPVLGLLLNRYFVSAVAGVLILRKIYTFKAG